MGSAGGAVGRGPAPSLGRRNRSAHAGACSASLPERDPSLGSSCPAGFPPRKVRGVSPWRRDEANQREIAGERSPPRSVQGRGGPGVRAGGSRCRLAGCPPQQSSKKVPQVARRGLGGRTGAGEGRGRGRGWGPCDVRRASRGCARGVLGVRGSGLDGRTRAGPVGRTDRSARARGVDQARRGPGTCGCSGLGVVSRETLGSVHTAANLANVPHPNLPLTLPPRPPSLPMLPSRRELLATSPNAPRSTLSFRSNPAPGPVRAPFATGPSPPQSAPRASALPSGVDGACSRATLDAAPRSNLEFTFRSTPAPMPRPRRPRPPRATARTRARRHGNRAIHHPPRPGLSTPRPQRILRLCRPGTAAPSSLAGTLPIAMRIAAAHLVVPILPVVDPVLEGAPDAADFRFEPATYVAEHFFGKAANYKLDRAHR